MAIIRCPSLNFRVHFCVLKLLQEQMMSHFGFTYKWYKRNNIWEFRPLNYTRYVYYLLRILTIDCCRYTATTIDVGHRSAVYDLLNVLFCDSTYISLSARLPARISWSFLKQRSAVLSPILYSLYISNQPKKHPDTRVAQYADYKVVYSINSDPDLVSMSIQNPLTYC